MLFLKLRSGLYAGNRTTAPPRNAGAHKSTSTRTHDRKQGQGLLLPVARRLLLLLRLLLQLLLLLLLLLALLLLLFACLRTRLSLPGSSRARRASERNRLLKPLASLAHREALTRMRGEPGGDERVRLPIW